MTTKQHDEFVKKVRLAVQGKAIRVLTNLRDSGELLLAPNMLTEEEWELTGDLIYDEFGRLIDLIDEIDMEV